ncbi:helix-turn-helix domain-containing protein [Kingella kingae]|uniref:helix-turn-helix domain-containing protein n=1 Tax=Kingella kingae TaxID=504 RepID=UPI00254C6060|nr:helix-turn-helix domain-containing protein [Kingella kingae]MDK4563726.1 helix-turn-helix domain-containing protein [Kingella kingae]MDK4578339.1 helix-turn-helix domain-containing protein [Kingella kingae]MDK4608387.1 helix-turn-helix domain-containing protein [Kingella kingae]MDK4625729.1 helix-turn-helix domain-containing protein [Kingella kingae]MDK4673561.1 helix-turn-helix domain-containing protein [Kingella kingae]
MQYDLAKWAVNARKQADLTQEQLAEAIGFSGKASVSAIEKGRNKPTFDIMLKIAEICHYPLPYQNQIIHNNAEHIQVAGNNFGEVSHVQNFSTENVPIFNLDNISKQHFTKIFSVQALNNDLQDIGILKDDTLIIDPNLKPKHGNIILVKSIDGRGLIAQLSIDLNSRFFLKYNKNEPEMMPNDVNIIGVITNLKRDCI